MSQLTAAANFSRMQSACNLLTAGGGGGGSLSLLRWRRWRAHRLDPRGAGLLPAERLEQHHLHVAFGQATAARRPAARRTPRRPRRSCCEDVPGAIDAVSRGLFQQSAASSRWPFCCPTAWPASAPMHAFDATRSAFRTRRAVTDAALVARPSSHRARKARRCTLSLRSRALVRFRSRDPAGNAVIAQFNASDWRLPRPRKIRRCPRASRASTPRVFCGAVDGQHLLKPSSSCGP